MPQHARWNWKPIHFVLLAIVVVLFVMYQVWNFKSIKDDLDDIFPHTPTPIVRPVRTPSDVQSG